MVHFSPDEALGVALRLLLEVGDLLVDGGDLGLEVADLLQPRLDRGRRTVVVDLDQALLQIISLEKKGEKEQSR